MPTEHSVRDLSFLRCDVVCDRAVLACCRQTVRQGVPPKGQPGIPGVLAWPRCDRVWLPSGLFVLWEGAFAVSS